MPDNQQSKDLMERLAKVDSKLEEMCNFLTYQASQPSETPAESPPAVNQEHRGETAADPWEDPEMEEASPPWAQGKNPLPARTAITASEAEGIIQRVEKINRDAEVLEKVERLERQTRKITIFGSMFMTITLLALTALAALMVQANLLSPGVILHAFHKGESPKPLSQEVIAKESEPQPAKPLAKVPDPKPAETVAAVSEPKPAPEVPHVHYVGSITSNKYHYPNCKWAAQIKPEKRLTFDSVTEARKRGYIPCPTCGPPPRDP
jgi:hypothetical protein